MRFAIIDAGRVVNVAISDAPLAANWIAAGSAQIGDTWDGVHFIGAAPVVAVPETISPRQFRQALSRLGQRAVVEAAVAAADQDVRDWYAYATSFERHHPTIAAMAGAMGIAPEELDAVWVYGASI